MNPPAPPVVGTTLPPDKVGAIEGAQSIGQLFGMDLTRIEALIILATLLFLFGVSLSCILKLNGPNRCWKVLISSIFTFLFTSPGWAYTLENKWLDDSTPLLDTVFQWIKGTGPVGYSFFALSVVILMGMFSWQLLQYVVRVAPKLGHVLMRMGKAAVARSTEESSSTEDSQERT